LLFFKKGTYLLSLPRCPGLIAGAFVDRMPLIVKKGKKAFRQSRHPED
jgi:hypothetical protein